MPSRSEPKPNDGRRVPARQGAGRQGRRVPPGADGARREAVLEAATELFYEKGYAATTTQDIGDRLGLLKGSLYYYIGSKEDLLYEIVKDVHEEGLRRIDELRGLPVNSLEKLRIFIERGISFVTAHPREIRIFFNDGRSLSPERQQLLRQQRVAYDAYLRDLLLRAQKDWVVCPDIDTHAAATAIVGLINWICYWYRPDGDIPPSALAREYANLILAGLACDPRTHESGHRHKIGLSPEVDGYIGNSVSPVPDDSSTKSGSASRGQTGRHRQEDRSGR